MTTVVIEKTGEQYKDFYVSGHSGYADAGDDIVCAAVSVLTINTINSLDELTEDQIEVITNEEDGFIRCIFKQSLSESGKLLMDSYVLGVNGIAAQYSSKFIQVKIREV